MSLGYENARRMIRTGTVKHADEGDLFGLPFTVQAKTQKADVTDAQIEGWYLDTRAQAKADRKRLGLLVVKRNGHADVAKSWVYLDALSMARLVLAPAVLSRVFQVNVIANDSIGRYRLCDIAPLLVLNHPPS